MARGHHRFANPWIPGYGWDRYGYRSTQSHLPKTHTHGLGMAGFSRHLISSYTISTTILHHHHTTIDATTHPGQQEHKQIQGGKE